MNLQGHRNDASESRPAWLFVALSLVHLDSAGVWLSCQAIIWISVLVGLFRVFANPVTYSQKFLQYVYFMHKSLIRIFADKISQTA